MSKDKEIILANLDNLSLIKFLKILEYRNIGLSLFEAEILYNANINLNEITRPKINEIYNIFFSKYPKPICPSKYQISKWLKKYEYKRTQRGKIQSTLTKEKFDIIDYDFELLADSKLFKNFFSTGMTNLGLIFFESFKYFKCYEISPGVICFPKGEMQRFYKIYQYRISNDWKYVAYIIKKLNESLHNAKNFLGNLENEIKLGLINRRTVINVFNSISITTALRYASVAFPYGKLKNYFSSIGFNEVQKIIHDLQFSNFTPIYIRYYSAYLNLVKKYSSGKINEKDIINFRKNNSFLESFSIKPSKFDKNEYDIKEELIPSNRDIYLQLSKMKNGRKISKRRMFMTMDKILFYSSFKKGKKLILLYNLIKLLNTFTTHEEARTYYELRALRSFRNIMNIRNMDIHTSTIKDIIGNLT